MKHFFFFFRKLLLLCFLGGITQSFGQCPSSFDSFTFTTQAQIDAFGITYAGCTNIILANVNIEGSDIVNLNVPFYKTRPTIRTYPIDTK